MNEDVIKPEFSEYGFMVEIETGQDEESIAELKKDVIKHVMELFEWDLDENFGDVGEWYFKIYLPKKPLIRGVDYKPEEDVDDEE